MAPNLIALTVLAPSRVTPRPRWIGDSGGNDNGIGVDTQMYRVTELLVHVRNLYAALGADPSSSLAIGVWHGGLKGRALRFSNRERIDPMLEMQAARAATAQP